MVDSLERSVKDTIRGVDPRGREDKSVAQNHLIARIIAVISFIDVDCSAATHLSGCNLGNLIVSSGLFDSTQGDRNHISKAYDHSKHFNRIERLFEEEPGQDARPERTSLEYDHLEGKRDK